MSAIRGSAETMPSVVATIQIKEDKIDEAKAFLRELTEKVRADEPGTLAYVFHQHKKDPTLFTAYEKYADDEAFAAHGANLQAHNARFAELLAKRPEIHILDEL
jgi:quinol monooxygenase YgiN